jgi:hypothetical protein
MDFVAVRRAAANRLRRAGYPKPVSCPICSAYLQRLVERSLVLVSAT